MKKIEFFIRNLYRIIIIRQGRNGKSVTIVADNEMTDPFDLLLRKAIKEDNSFPDTESDLRSVLEQRVARKAQNGLHGNSLADILLPLVSFKNFEIKMAAITIALILFMRIGPIMNHSTSRSIQPAFLADTLIDSSIIHLWMPDSSLRLP
jgi:hypothetical protein